MSTLGGKEESPSVSWHKALMVIAQGHTVNMPVWAPQHITPVLELLCSSEYLHQNEKAGSNFLEVISVLILTE